MTPKKYCPFTLGKVVPSYCVEEECAVFIKETSCIRGDNDKCEYEDTCSPGCKFNSHGHCGMILL